MSYYVVEFEFCFFDGWNSHTLRSEHLSAMEEQRRLIQSGKTFKSIFIIMFSAVILRGLVFSINLSSTLPNGEKAGAFAFVAQVLLMHFSWMISLVRQNASLVDFAWPAGLAYMATNYGVWGKAYELRRYLICAMYLMHSSRRVLAWWVTHSRWSNEDRRYAIWRERWTSGQAWFKSKSVEMNFLVFFQSRAIINTFVLSVPLHLTCVVFPPAESAGLGESLHWLEVFAFLVWCVAFGTQIVADQQLANFHRFERLNDGTLFTFVT
jgi:steroid 5-alpha reductase family enzyme